MSSFTSPLDIANRALQHCGVRRIGGTAWPPTEDTRQAAETTFAYDKVRRAELRRNQWQFATRRAALRPLDTNTMLLNPVVWSVTTTYGIGSIVADSANVLWTSNWSVNLGNTPGQSKAWSLYFGPLTVSLWNDPGAAIYSSTSAAAYFAGELVYTTANQGNFFVYVSLINNNTDQPTVADVWSATTIYPAQAVVSYNSVLYQSNFDQNLNSEPDLSPTPWASGTTYAANALVTGSNLLIYKSVGSGNIGHNPVTDAGVHWTNQSIYQPWSTTITVGSNGSMNWRLLTGAQVQDINIMFPIGSGPASQSETQNLYMLPNGFLHPCQQVPGGEVPFLGGPGPSFYNDWQYESNFIITSDVYPIVLRFIADVSDVPMMDDMFCEGLACRVAESVVETLTQSTSKLQGILAEYNRFMGEARTVNAIVAINYQDPPEDDYVAVRY